MTDARPGDVIVGTVLELLESEGYDAVQLREVARRARVSLATIYKLFPTRDELIIAAVERWMAVNTLAPLAGHAVDEPLYDGLMRVFRHVFEPWERSPRMLEAFHRARISPGGERLDEQARAAIEPISRAAMATGDPAYIEDVGMILEYLSYAVMGRVTAGELDSTDILPILERAVHRLTADNRSDAEATVRRRAE